MMGTDCDDFAGGHVPCTQEGEQPQAGVRADEALSATLRVHREEHGRAVWGRGATATADAHFRRRVDLRRPSAEMRIRREGVGCTGGCAGRALACQTAHWALMHLYADAVK